MQNNHFWFLIQPMLCGMSATHCHAHFNFFCLLQHHFCFKLFYNPLLSDDGTVLLWSSSVWGVVLL